MTGSAGGPGGSLCCFEDHALEDQHKHKATKKKKHKLFLVMPNGLKLSRHHSYETIIVEG